MATALLILQFVALAWPLIIQGVQMVEAAVKQGMADGSLAAIPSNADRQSAALAFFQKLWPTIDKTGTGAKLAALISPEDFASLTTGLVDGAVSFLKALGIMGSTKATAIPAAAPTA